MRLLRYAVLILFPVFVHGRQVHFYKSLSGGAIGLHSGASASELRASWLSAGFSVTLTTPACPYYPQGGHYAGTTWIDGTWGQIITVSGQMYYGQGGSDGTMTPDNGGAVQPCPTCRGANEYFNHTIQTLAENNSANADWIWNGGRTSNPYIDTFDFIYDEAGNITGYTVSFNGSSKPFGAYEEDIPNGITGNGQWDINPTTGPYWRWNEGVNPPIDPVNITEMTTTLNAVNVTLGQAKQEITLVKEELIELNAAQKDYTSNFDSLELAVSSISMTPFEGDVNVSVDNIAVVDAINDLKDTVMGEAGYTADPDLAEAITMDSDKQGILDSLEGVKSGFMDGISAGELLGGVLDSVIGNWKDLPRVRPNLSIDKTVVICGYNLSIVWSSSVIPEDWWLYVQILRSFEVIGLAIYFLWKCQQLLLDTFGGA